MSTLPTFIKSWNFSKLNQRITYVSLNDTMATLLYGTKDYLVGTMGASVVWSCNGTTGPTNSSDNTDRWTSKAAATTRATATTSPNSWIVIQWAGVQFLMSYVGGSDDIATLRWSQGSLYTLAGTTTHTPTATDEAIIAVGTTLIGATASADRVYSILASSDRTMFRLYCFRQGAVTKHFGLERFAEAPGIAAGYPMGWNSSIGYQANAAVAGHGAGASGGGAGAADSHAIYYNGASRVVVGGTVYFGASTTLNVWNISNPQLNGAQPIYPVFIGCSDVGNLGWFGTRYDAFVSIGLAAHGDVIDDVTSNTRIMYIGEGIMTPWDINQGLVTT